MRLHQPLDARWGIAAVRIMMGVILVVAGFQKWVGGIAGTVGFFTQLGIPVPQLMGPIIATGEVVGGLLILLGLGARWVALWFVAEFLVTTLVAKLPRQGWDSARIDLMLLAGSVMLALAGAGKLALDERMAVRRGAATETPGYAPQVARSR